MPPILPPATALDVRATDSQDGYPPMESSTSACRTTRPSAGVHAPDSRRSNSNTARQRNVATRPNHDAARLNPRPIGTYTTARGPDTREGRTGVGAIPDARDRELPVYRS